MKRGMLTIVLVAAFLTGCGNMQSNSKEMDHSKMTQESDSTQNGKVQAQFKLSSEKPLPNQDTTITIQVQDSKGKPIDKLDTVHEKMMHVIVVSKDLSFFNHIHPAYKGNGEFVVKTQFPTAGEFKVIADFTPTGMSAMNKSQWFTIQGNGPAPKPVEPDTSLTKVVEGKEVTLSIDHLMANMELTLNFNIKDALTKKPVTDLQPYLGAVGHVVILSQDAENYLHVHPTEEKAKGPDAAFMTTFPHSGVYKIWGQFQQNDKVFMIPFVVKVP
ncbi:hypothetical protein A8709_18915 [Paenibacillus pectinilyticus]|uniref:YtkA-like domain-containing protein n=1 Tax=Paenibacillus pectinilyticus TaxID=512399 RepID=A0A1C0ZZX4_9BACL|nr:hypothetical protein [Paenibacillus pectinilyticus]OCT13660.1 hypothetical protein A8709_18915 [Paenibacillus pectinilyticus]